MTWIIFILGAMIAGFVQGLTGFAFALIAMSFWIWVLPPQLAAPLVVFASLWSHIISLSKEQKLQLPFSLALPYIIAGLIGVPLGTYLLNLIDGHTFKIILGLFLIIWCPIMFFAPEFPRIQKLGKVADSGIGFIGGILGGLGGFCGAAPSAWLMLKNLPKAQQRYILRHFNFAIQLFTILIYLWHGNIEKTHLPYFGLIILTVSVPALIGAQLFYKISEKQFKYLVLSLLFASGCFLLFTSLLQ
ncbi:sulfite exporter TauE/SafE family protein [Acinetobacter wuhouensis]|uniref:sulfite exporter TauE/SafE family protein n=1 Tax=Acinetobacter wuhouensis TaxID=1879050 RepID=UPI0010233298|nr:sulfite exporter TauE/SafE family protein [Acinetobacter wuhouensis]RZG73803.1 sulfite exporter TauE/SafE family protein [Acinetobacter wuhouensis]